MGFATAADTKLLRASVGTVSVATNLSALGTITASLGYYFASGTGITNAWLTNATLDFPSTAAGTASEMTINLTNVSDGDFPTLSPPAALAVGVNGQFVAVCTNGYVIVRFINNNLVTAVDPASGNFRVKVEKVK